MKTRLFIAGRRSGKQVATRDKVDNIIQNIIKMNWDVEPDEITKEKYLQMLALLPKDAYEDLIMGKWVQPEDEE